MTTAVQQQQHQQQQQLQHHPHYQHSHHQGQQQQHQHSHHQQQAFAHQPQQQQHQRQTSEQQLVQQQNQQRTQLFNMDADFWQQARDPFGLHAAAALATNQLHHHHQHQQHQQQHAHPRQQQHMHQAQQAHHAQQSPLISSMAVVHADQQQKQTQPTMPVVPPHEQHQQNHHLLFNAAAAAAAAVHLSGVVKSNELHAVASGLNVDSNATSAAAGSCNTHEVSAIGISSEGDSHGNGKNAITSSERLGISVKQEVQTAATSTAAAAAPATVAVSANNQQQQPQHSEPKYQPSAHNAIDALHQQLQQQLQQQHNLTASASSGGDETDKFSNQLKAQQTSAKLHHTANAHQQQQQQAQHAQAQPNHGTHPHPHQQQQHSQTQSQQLQQNAQQQQQQQTQDMGTGPSSPLPMHCSGGTALVPLQSPQQSLTPSGGSSTPDIKYNSEKLVNEIQLQLSRSNSAAAISERTLEECWSTLQRTAVTECAAFECYHPEYPENVTTQMVGEALPNINYNLFMHKSAMQQIQQIPRVGLGAPGSMGTESKPHQCQQCLKSFSSNHQLVQHIRVHTGEKPYKCSYCDRRFKQLSHVQQHTRLHTGERPYKCHLPDCGRAFIQLSNLQQHLRNHDAQVERAKNRPFHCNICGKGFATESSLRTHTSKELQLHLGVLQQHAALIGGPNATSCPVCHKLFLGADALMEHMKHTHKEKPAPSSPYIDSSGSGGLQSTSSDVYLAKRRTANHPCPVCGKHYVNEGSLRKHLACHPETTQLTNSLRMWPCSVCQAVFTHENGLLTHMEHMRMDPKHQFAAQYVLSRAAAERRERDSILAATLAASASCGASGGGNGGSGLLPLLGDGGGSNSLCPSPSANSECSSTGRLSSSAASDQGSGIHMLNNNNNNDNDNKLNQLLSRTGSNPHLSSQYGVGVDSDLHVANRMSLMAAASAAAAAVAASTSGVGVSGGVNVGGVSGMGMASPSGCVDSTRSSVQAAVVNLAAAMRINQVSQQQAGGTTASSGGIGIGPTNNSGAVGAGNMVNNTPSQQQHLHPQHHQQQPQQPQQQQHVSAIDNHETSTTTPLTSGGLSVGVSSPGPDASAVNAVATMTAMRDTMMRTSMSVVDPLSGVHQQIDQHAHGHVQHHTTNNLQPSHTNYGQHSAPTTSSGHQMQHQVATTLQNPGSHHHHHHHLNQMQQPHSPETALRMHQHAEAILRSHTAFRLAASVAASNSVIGTGTGPSNIIGVGNNERVSMHGNNTIQVKAEIHQTQQQQLSDDAILAQQEQHQQQQHQHTTSQQQQKLNATGSIQQSTVIASQQSQLTSDLSEAIRLQEHRLEQALRLHNDARALNFLTAAQHSVNTATATANNATLQHQQQQQAPTAQHHSNA